MTFAELSIGSHFRLPSRMATDGRALPSVRLKVAPSYYVMFRGRPMTQRHYCPPEQVVIIIAKDGAE